VLLCILQTTTRCCGNGRYARVVASQESKPILKTDVVAQPPNRRLHGLVVGFVAEVVSRSRAAGGAQVVRPRAFSEIEGSKSMSVLQKLACMQNGRDQVPNKELAKELAEKRNVEEIKEIAENLWNKDKNIQSDCASVLEEIGHLAPELIEDYVSDFLKLLSSNNNRLVWGAMITLSIVADRKPKQIFDNLDDIVEAIEKGSVITRDNGIKTLAIVASGNEEYNEAIFPFLIEHLKRCRPKDVPQHAESIMCAVTLENQVRYIDVLKQRFDTPSSSQQRRVKKLLRMFESGG
jgi:hypothetical protein